MSSAYRRRAAAVALSLAVLSASADEAQLSLTSETRLLGAVESLCGGAAAHAEAQEPAPAGMALVDKSPLVIRGRRVGTRRRFALADGSGEMLLESIEPGGRLHRIRGEYHAAAGDANVALRPQAIIVADGQCRVRTARRLTYDAHGDAEYIEQLSPALDEVRTREPLNPPVPAAGEDAARSTEAPAVAMVDAGVNYLLPRIGDRLARNADGEILGFDYWDLDERPFDSNPARSPFFPQRHGTQTASLVLREAPHAGLVPYRYPRPDMARMSELIEDAAAKGLVVLNLSLGGNHAGQWQAFGEAAAEHPEMLFVVSAGNNGRDIDSQPVYPASLDLENMLVVSSADADGRPAEGSNWGRESVDLLVPAEEVLVTDFYGLPKVVSGSSYAAARVSALAVCLLEANPEWRASELKEAIVALAQVPAAGESAYSIHGFLPDPAARQRGACAALPRQVAESSRFIWTPEDLSTATLHAQLAPTHELRPTLIIFDGAGWQLDAIREATGSAARILAQCGIAIPEVTVRVVEAPERARIFRHDWSTALVSELAPEKPAVFFVEDTLYEAGFDVDAVALGRSNSRKHRMLADTVWITPAMEDLDVGLAHELYHALADSGQHDEDVANLMHERSKGDNTLLRGSQCLRLIRVGEALGNLTPAQ